MTGSRTCGCKGGGRCERCGDGNAPPLCGGSFWFLDSHLLYVSWFLLLTVSYSCPSRLYSCLLVKGDSSQKKKKR